MRNVWLLCFVRSPRERAVVSPWLTERPLLWWRLTSNHLLSLRRPLITKTCNNGAQIQLEGGASNDFSSDMTNTPAVVEAEQQQQHQQQEVGLREEQYDVEAIAKVSRECS